MKTNRALTFRSLVLSLPLFIGTALWAAPLTWFPGPTLDTPVSEAATLVYNGNNVLIGGYSDYLTYGYTYPFSLSATNAYWNYLPAIYSVNIAPGAILTDGMFFIYGGSDGTNSQNTAIAYSLTGDTVPTPPAMSVPRSFLGYAPDRNGNAYAFGGLDANGNALASAERYNPGNNNWTSIASLPAPRFDFPAVFNRTNYIYIFGGYTGTNPGMEAASMLRYNVSGNSWSNMAAMPVAVAGSAATLGPDGKIYVCGGTAQGMATDLVQVYNPISNSWTLATSLPEALTGAAAGVDALGRLVIMGGTDINGNNVGNVWRSQQLNVPDSLPAFATYPNLLATFLVPYISSITATGNPQPVYQLVSGPDGMAVDNYSGAITWTPQASQIGTNTVTISAVNFAGATNFSYNLVIARPPPTVLTNLSVVSVTESSVTLSWSPEDPVVGPVTYRAYLRHVLHSPKGSGATIWYTQIGSTTTDTNLTISGLAAGLSQGYYITATGVSGTSEYASIGAATLPAPAPANFRVTGLTSSTISLAWDAPVGPVPVVSYQIIGVFNGVFVQSALNFVNLVSTNTTLTGLAPGTAMQWGVRAYDTLGNYSSYVYLPALVVNPVPTHAQFSSAVSAAGGSFQFTVSLGAAQTVVVQATTNPGDASSWSPIATFMPTNNPFTFTDPDAAQFASRFYRIITP